MRRIILAASAVPLILALAACQAEGFSLADGGGGSGSGSGSGSKPEKLPSSASYQEAMDKLDEIIAYCDAAPGNNEAKRTAQSTKDALFTSSMIQTYWSSYSSTMSSRINNIIDVLI